MRAYCLETANISGPCHECGASLLNGVHLCGLAIYCADHCPACRPAEPLPEGETVTISGEQKELF